MDAITIQLKQFFHALPFEMKELIQRFTYKTQNKNLLNEIREVAGAKYYLQELTGLIDTAHFTDGFYETTHGIYERLGPGLNFLRDNRHKEELIKNWKYKLEFQSAQQSHLNDMQIFLLLNWETSFAVYFWMCIYH
jgi:hypothetical protein